MQPFGIFFRAIRVLGLRVKDTGRHSLFVFFLFALFITSQNTTLCQHY